MKTRRNVLTVVNLFLLPLVLLHFQNCSSASGPNAQASDSSGGGTVGIIEQNSKAQLQFVQNSVQIKDNVSATAVDGFCNSQHDGAQLRWTVWGGADSATPLATGTAACEQGAFDVNMVNLNQFTCGESELLTIEGDWGGSTFTHVTHRCQPASSVAVATPDGSPAGTSCDLEYSVASTSAPQSCVEVCYRDNKVVSSVNQAANLCSSLVAKVTN